MLKSDAKIQNNPHSQKNILAFPKKKVFLHPITKVKIYTRGFYLHLTTVDKSFAQSL